MTIGEKIASLRKQQNLTQEQLARALDISVPAVSKWENGATMPDISLLAPIARMLHTDIVISMIYFRSRKKLQKKMWTFLWNKSGTNANLKGIRRGWNRLLDCWGSIPTALT